MKAVALTNKNTLRASGIQIAETKSVRTLQKRPVKIRPTKSEKRFFTKFTGHEQVPQTFIENGVARKTGGFFV